MRANRVALIIANIGVLLIVIGLGVQMIQYQEQIDKQKKVIDSQATELIRCREESSKIYEDYLRLEEENMALWNNYYMNVTNQEGYEYYE